MSLLSVTVKKARYVSIQGTQFNTYVTLKLQNVKSTTVTVKGSTPSWEQDFLFEINDINLGLLVEVWNKGVIWDRALGYHYLPLTAVAYEEQGCGGRWIELEAQLMMRGGAVVGTTGSTGHALLLECRFEPPFDAEGTAGADLQRKLDLLNGALDAERAEQARRQMQYIAHSGYSEDSDYTSDLNYPVGQHPNCSVSQFRNAAHQIHTPQRSLEVSRENSYERDEYHLHGDTDPLYYNSQPRTRIETWSQYQPQLHAQASVESAISWRTAADWQSAEDQRRPSLERQTTLYDDIGYPYDTYTTSIRDSHLSQQPSYEEYFDSSSYAPYQTTYLGDDPRWQDRMYCEDSYGLMSTEYENIINKRRSSVVQLPHVPHKQHSSRFSDFNGMAPYKPRSKRIAASLPGTPSSTPRRGRSLPRPPGGSETGSVKSRGRRLPPTPATTHVPYITEAEKSFPPVSYGYDSYGFKTEYQDNITDQYQDTNYNTSYDEDGMQPFFDETPHATPPAAVQKSSWTETDTINQFTYPISHETDNIISKPRVKLPQPPVINQHEQYSDQKYQDYNEQYTDQNYEQYDETEQIIQQKPYQEQNENYLDQNYDLSYQSQQYEQQYEEQYLNNQYQETEYQKDQYQTNQQQYQANQLNQQQVQTNHLNQQQLKNTQQVESDQLGQQHYQLDQFGQQYQTDQYGQQYQKDLLGQHQQQDQQKKEPVQQLQTTMMTGAATLGSLMAGGAKKLGSFFGAAAAAVAPPTAITQPQLPSATSAPQLTPFTSSVTSITPYTSSAQLITSASVPEVSPSIPVSTVTSSPPTLPRTPSLKRQESIIRPPIQKIRTLPEAPEDMPLSEFEEGVYEDDYNKTDYDRTSLDQYPDINYLHDTIQEEDVDQTSSVQKTSPTRNGSVRKPSVDSYHSVTPSIVDRRTSQISYEQEDTVAVPTTQEESLTDKSKVKFKDDRTTYHEVPETNNTFQQNESFDDQQEDYREETDQFEDQDQEFHEEEDQYQEEEFQEERPEIHKFKEEQPKLTPKQRWHRAYNKVVMQLNVSLLTFS